MALQDCGALYPERPEVEQEFDGVEDTRGMDAFLEWVTGPGNKEIRRVALEGDGGVKQDYLTGLSCWGIHLSSMLMLCSFEEEAYHDRARYEI